MLLLPVTCALLGYVSTTGAVSDAEFCSLLHDFNEFKAEFDSYLAHEDASCNSVDLHADCMSLKDMFPSAVDGTYKIEPKDGKGSFDAYCDMTTDGGGWLVLQRRIDGKEDFQRSWFDFRNGFGNISGEFWLGNEIIHRLTTQNIYTIRFDLSDFEGNKAYATYDVFSIADMSQFYKLSVSSNFHGNAGDSFSALHGAKFATDDLDSTGCAKLQGGGWWFLPSLCSKSDLNAPYNDTALAHKQVVMWEDWKGKSHSLRTTEIKIRPKILN